MRSVYRCQHCYIDLDYPSRTDIQFHISGDCRRKLIKESEHPTITISPEELYKMRDAISNAFSDLSNKEDQYEKLNRLNIIRYTRATDKMFLLDEKIHHEDMVAFGQGWWKGWRVGIISGLLLGAMWTWIAIEVWKL